MKENNEKHTISFDGFGFNGSDEYKTRLNLRSKLPCGRRLGDKIELAYNSHAAHKKAVEILERILRSHKSNNNGAYMGEAVLCRYFEDLAANALEEVKSALAGASEEVEG